jgi:hypothetical protein
MKRTRAECQRAGRLSVTRRGHSRRGHGDSGQGDSDKEASRGAKDLSNGDRKGRRAGRDRGLGKGCRFPTTAIIPHGINNLARQPACGPFPFPVQT